MTYRRRDGQTQRLMLCKKWTV